MTKRLQVRLPGGAVVPVTVDATTRRVIEPAWVESVGAREAAEAQPARPAGVSSISAAERQALIDLYNATNGVGWTHNTNWLGAAGTECSWYGVGCDGQQTTVVYLDLEYNNLVGTIPASLSDLVSLTHLDLYYNTLSGTIPTGLTGLYRLTYLRLGWNQFTGPIPNFGSLYSLTTLHIGANPFTAGLVPSWISNLMYLNDLDLQDSNLVGPFPAFSNLPLSFFWIQNNSFDPGPVPTWVATKTTLSYLGLDGTNRNGPLPNLSACSNLHWLGLSSNAFDQGPVPSWVAGLSNLQYLFFSSAQRTGSIPTWLGSLTNLYDLSLNSNQLTGPIPSELASLANLRYLYLSSNQLSGSIPGELGNLVNLRSLDLTRNQLSGPIPSQIGSLSRLQNLWLRANQLSGAIPTSLVNLTSLVANSSDLRYNALYSTDPTLTAFLNGKQYGGNWQSTQTVAPTNVEVGSATSSSVTLSWTPITYIGDTGGYQAYFATTSGGPYSTDGITANKSATSLVVSGLNASTTYYFVVRTVTNPNSYNANTVTSDPSAEVHATTTGGCVPATITVQPQGQTITSGQRATLTVTATGTTPLSYQWYQGFSGDTSHPVGGDGASYTTPALTATTSYWVRVSNACGHADSVTATVTVCTEAMITVQPQGQTISTGQTATLSVAARGTPPLSYQWYQGYRGDSTHPVGANSASYTTPALTATTSYWVHVSNSCGHSDSVTATVTVSGCVKPTITAEPQGVTIPSGQRATLSVVAVGEAPLAYRWYQGESGDTSQPVAGGTASTLLTPPLMRATSYWVRVTSRCGATEDSVAATVTILRQLVVDPTALAVTVARGSTATAMCSLSVTQGTASFGVTSSVPWARVTPGSGTVTAGAPWVTVTVTFDATTAAVGTASGQLSFADPAGNAQPVSVNVAMTVVQPQSPTFSVSPSALVFEAATGDVPAEQTLQIINTGHGDMAWSVSSSKDWIGVSPASGVLSGGRSAGLTVAVAAAGETGSLVGAVRVQVPGASDAVVRVTRNAVAPVARGAWEPSNESTAFLPNIATGLPGLNGSFWATDVHAMRVSTAGGAAGLSASAAASDDLRSSAEETTADTSLSVATMVRVGAGAQADVAKLGFPEQRSMLLSDVLRAFLGRSSEQNTLQLRGAGAADVITWARTFTTQMDGSTFGQDVASPRTDEIIPVSGGAVAVAGLVNSAAFRSNMAISEMAGADTAVSVQAYDEDGAPIGTPLRGTVPAFGTWKIVGILPALGVASEECTVVVSSSGGGWISAMASVVDNVTNDPYSVMGKVVASAAAGEEELDFALEPSTGALYLPAVAHLAGLYGTQWRSDLVLLNVGQAAADVTLDYLPEGGAGAVIHGRTVALSRWLAGMTMKDVVASEFGVSAGKGTIRITSSRLGSIAAHARTYTENPDSSTYGQDCAAIRDDETLSTGPGTLYLVGLEESSRFRSNVGVVNVGDTPAQVSLTASVTDQPDRTVEFDVQPGQLIQFTRFMSSILGYSGDLVGAVVKVKVLGINGRVLAYGSVVDNRSQDPVFVRAARR